MRSHIESQIQRNCVKWMRYQHPEAIMFAVPNGGIRSKTEASIMSGEGVLKGVADLFIMYPSGQFHGLFIEIKSEKGRQTDYQRIFESNAVRAGYRYAVCRSVDEFINAVEKYLKPNI